MNSSNNINTPYDDVFRTMMNRCKKLLIPLVNEVFQKNHDTSEGVVLESNEHFIMQQDGKQEKRISDSNFRIGNSLYQIECQSTYDGNIMIRVWEYGAQIAVRNAMYDSKNAMLILQFPETAILYLRCKNNTPDFTNVCVKFPNAECIYKVPNIKISSYSIEDIFEKKLFFLIPFYLFVYEHNFKFYENNKIQLDSLKYDIMDIFLRLNNNTMNDLTEFERTTIKDMTKKIVENLTKNYLNIQKGLGEIMGGKILDHRANDIRLELLFDLVKDKLIELTDAAAKVSMPESEFSERYKTWESNNNCI